jgi:hypothetical protein
MNFNEYLIQADPKYMPDVSIEVDDMYQYFTVPGGHIVVLRIKEELYSYYVPDDSLRLFTMDQDGNKKSRSCFKLKSPLR